MYEKLDDPRVQRKIDTMKHLSRFAAFTIFTFRTEDSLFWKSEKISFNNLIMILKLLCIRFANFLPDGISGMMNIFLSSNLQTPW